MFCHPILSNYQAKGNSIDMTRFYNCRKYLEDSIFDKYKSCMRENQYSNKICKRFLPEYLRDIEGARDLRKLLHKVNVIQI